MSAYKKISKNSALYKMIHHHIPTKNLYIVIIRQLKKNILRVLYSSLCLIGVK